MKINLLEPIGVDEKIILEFQEKLKKEGHEFTFYPNKTTDAEELKRRSEGCEIVMIANTPYPAEVIAASPSLKMIDVAFTGIDHVGLQKSGREDVMICNAAGYSDQTVAELAIGMAIGALRKMTQADALTRNGGTGAAIMGQEICGKTVGIVGLGKIGMRTAQLFQAFGAKVIAYNRSKSAEAEKQGISYCPLEEVLSQSDIVSLHLPLNDATRGFIDAQKIALLKKDAVFINCARGPIVDNRALASALNEDRLGFACIDVFDMEPPIPSQDALLQAKNTLLTPHIAYYSKESMQRRAQIVFDNVFAYLKGNPVNVCVKG